MQTHYEIQKEKTTTIIM